MLRRFFPAYVSFVACVGLASASPVRAEPAGRTKVLYAGDTRQDAIDHPEGALRKLARESTAALIPLARLHLEGDRVRMDSGTLSEARNLCPDEPFAEQMAAADCSSVLVGKDLLLTAGHCVYDAHACSQMGVVFDYALDAHGEVVIEPGDVYGCAELIDRALTTDIGAEKMYDHALLRLDRPVDGARRPVTVRRVPVERGERLVLIGNGHGLPTKIDDDGLVVEPRLDTLDYFEAYLDNFESGSGSGVFDVDGLLVGVAVRGAADTEVHEGESCERVRSLPRTPVFTEGVSYAAPIVEGVEGVRVVDAATGAEGCRSGGGRGRLGWLPWTVLGLLGWWRRRVLHRLERCRVA